MYNRSDLNDFTIIELQSALSNLIYDISSLELSAVQEVEYYNMTLNKAFETLQINNNSK